MKRRKKVETNWKVYLLEDVEKGGSRRDKDDTSIKVVIPSTGDASVGNKRGITMRYDEVTNKRVLIIQVYCSIYD